MPEAPGLLLQEEETETPCADLRLLVEPEPWFRVFLQNLRAFFQRSEVFSQKSAIANHINV